jgi:TRAP-type mannitol/chloroaromatic compound transport system permease large subunit
VIWRGVLPFIAIQLSMLVLLCVLPELATWLPAQIGD